MQYSIISSPLDFMFRPRAIAVAGVSDNESGINMGRDFIKALLNAGFPGALYPLNPSGGEILGLKIWKHVREIPGPIDYVISAVPARYARHLLNDCIEKGVKIVHFFTAGFGEIENEGGKRLQADIYKMAKEHGIRIIGPNCMGVYCPASGLSFARDLPNQPGFPTTSGEVGFISQSGGNAIYFVRKAANAGIYCSKVVSYGNAIDVNESDLLEYLAKDADTKIIAAYIEGVQDGRRFIRLLSETSETKPVIIFKAGDTEEGTRAAASHTGAMSGAKVLWPHLLKQTGAIQAGSIDEIVDLTLLFLTIKPPKGRNAVIFGTGGGATVKAADDCALSGLELPPIPADLRLRLRDIFGTEAGNIFTNPLDLMPILGTEELVDTIKMVVEGMGIDLLILQVAFDTWSLMDRAYSIHYYVDCTIRLKSFIDKPIVAVLHYVGSGEAEDLATCERARLLESGIPVFQSIERAARAVDRLIRYSQRFGAKQVILCASDLAHFSVKNCHKRAY